MVDPTFGWGKIIADKLATFFIWLTSRLLEEVWEMFKKLFDLLALEFTYWFFELGRRFVRGFDFVGEFFSSFWVEVGKWYKLFTGIRDSVQWFMDFCTDAYNFYEWFVLWLVGEDDGFGQWLWETLQKGLTWLGDFFVQLWERAQNFIFDNGLWIYEWVIGILDDCIGYFINLIHTIFEVTGIHVVLPNGTDNAILQFFQWGMFFNEFLPIQELFQLLGVYLIFLVMMSFVRFIRSLIPFLH